MPRVNKLPLIKRIGKRLPRNPAQAVLLAAVFLLPLIFWPEANTSFELPKVTLFRTLLFFLAASVVATTTFAAMAKKNLKDAGSDPDFKRIKIPLILFALMIVGWVVSTILSSAPAVGVFGYYPRFQGIYTLACLVIFAAIVFLSSGNGKTVDRILTVVVASSFLVALSAFLQSWGVPWLNHWDVSAFLGRFFGTMGHPDYLASFLVIAIPIQIERLLANRGRLLAILALSFSLAALSFTLSRAAFLGLFFALLLFLIIAAKKLALKKLFIAALLTPILLLSALFSVNALQGNDFVNNNPLLSRMVLKDENLRSVQTRLVLWPATVRQIIDSPFFGYGPDSYAITFPKYAPAELNTLENLGDYPDRAHNFLLDYAVQFGIPGLAVFLGLLAVIFSRTMRFIFGRKTGWMLPLALMSALSGLLVANLFGFFVTVTWVYFWLIMAVLLRLTTPRTREILEAKKSHYGVAALTTSAALATVAVVTIIAGVAVVATQDVFLLVADISYRDGDAGAAARLAPQISFYSYREAVALTNTGKTSAAAPVADAAPFTEATVALERMGRITGYDGLYYLQKGKLLSSTATADDETFISAFDSAIAKMPTYAPAYLAYGKALYAHSSSAEDFARAADILEKYLALCPPYYLWKDDLGARSPEEQERYRIFYKLNPDFNDVLPMIADAFAKSA